MKRPILLCCALVAAMLFSGCKQSNKDSNTLSDISASSSQSSVPYILREYDFDSLQNVFIGITDKTTQDDLNAEIKNKSLCHTVQENNSSFGKTISYGIAYTEGAAAQRYSDSGDYLEATFLKDSGKIMHAQYVNEHSSKSALYYNYGTWFDFNEKSPGKYTGYYYVDPLSKYNGITIQYSNGREKTTHYFNAPNAKIAVQVIIDDLVENGYSNNVHNNANSSENISSNSPESSVTSEDSNSSQISIPEKTNFRNTVWGMTRDEVKQIETLELQYEEEPAILYNATNVAGLSAIPCYAFDDVQKLYAGAYSFVLQHTSESLYIDDFYSVGDLLDEKYGQGKYDYEWKNDLYKDDFYQWGYAISIGQLSMVAVWETPETKITLELSGDNRQIDLNLLYISKTYKQVLNSQTDGL